MLPLSLTQLFYTEYLNIRYILKLFYPNLIFAVIASSTTIINKTRKQNYQANQLTAREISNAVM